MKKSKQFLELWMDYRENGLQQWIGLWTIACGIFKRVVAELTKFKIDIASLPETNCEGSGAEEIIHLCALERHSCNKKSLSSH